MTFIGFEEHAVNAHALFKKLNTPIRALDNSNPFIIKSLRDKWCITNGEVTKKRIARVQVRRSLAKCDFNHFNMLNQKNQLPVIECLGTSVPNELILNVRTIKNFIRFNTRHFLHQFKPHKAQTISNSPKKNKTQDASKPKGWFKTTCTIVNRTTVPINTVKIKKNTALPSPSKKNELSPLNLSKKKSLFIRSFLLACLYRISMKYQLLAKRSLRFRKYKALRRKWILIKARKKKQKILNENPLCFFSKKNDYHSKEKIIFYFNRFTK